MCVYVFVNVYAINVVCMCASLCMHTHLCASVCVYAFGMCGAQDPSPGGLLGPHWLGSVTSLDLALDLIESVQRGYLSGEELFQVCVQEGVQHAVAHHRLCPPLISLMEILTTLAPDSTLALEHPARIILHSSGLEATQLEPSSAAVCSFSFVSSMVVFSSFGEPKVKVILVRSFSLSLSLSLSPSDPYTCLVELGAVAIPLLGTGLNSSFSLPCEGVQVAIKEGVSFQSLCFSMFHCAQVEGDSMESFPETGSDSHSMWFEGNTISKWCSNLSSFAALKEVGCFLPISGFSSFCSPFSVMEDDGGCVPLWCPCQIHYCTGASMVALPQYDRAKANMQELLSGLCASVWPSALLSQASRSSCPMLSSLLRHICRVQTIAKGV